MIEKSSYEFAVWIAIIFLIGSTIAILTFIIISRVIKSLKSDRLELFKKTFGKRLNNLIVLEMYSKEGNPPSALTFQLEEMKKEMTGSSEAKQIMVDQMVIHHENLSGGAAKLIEQTYKLLELHRFSLKKLRSWSWKKRARAISELTKMNCDEAINEIKAISRSRNKSMSDKGLMALVRLDSQKGLQFLDSYEGDLTRWMQLNIHHHLNDINISLIPDFSRWFDNANLSVRIFAINMAGQFKQSPAIPALTNLLIHKDNRVVEAAIDALEIMEAHSSFNALLAVSDRLWMSEKTMAKLANCIGRLVLPSNGLHELRRFFVHPSYEVRFQAIKAVCLLGSEQREEMQNFNLTNGMKYSGILLHVDEPLLN